MAQNWGVTGWNSGGRKGLAAVQAVRPASSLVSELGAGG